MEQDYTVFKFFIEQIQCLKHIYPSYFVGTYGSLLRVTFDGKRIEFSETTVDLFRKAVKYVFIPDDGDYERWCNREWLEGLPAKPQDWVYPTHNLIMRNNLINRLLHESKER